MREPGGMLSEADHLRIFLADRDQPCPSCAYNLRSLAAGSCPECGQRLALRVSLAEPRLARWIAALVGAAAGTGFNGLLVLYILCVMLSEGSRSRGRSFDAFVVCNVVGLALMAPALGALILFGRRFRRAAPSTQSCFAVGIWGLVAADFAAFLTSVK